MHSSNQGTSAGSWAHIEDPHSSNQYFFENYQCLAVQRHLNAHNDDFKPVKLKLTHQHCFKYHTYASASLLECDTIDTLINVAEFNDAANEIWKKIRRRFENNSCLFECCGSMWDIFIYFVTIDIHTKDLKRKWCMRMKDLGKGPRMTVMEWLFHLRPSPSRPAATNPCVQQRGTRLNISIRHPVVYVAFYRALCSPRSAYSRLARLSSLSLVRFDTYDFLVAMPNVRVFRMKTSPCMTSASLCSTLESIVWKRRHVWLARRYARR